MKPDYQMRSAQNSSSNRSQNSSVFSLDLAPSPFDPLLTITAARTKEATLVCIPGAGASITTFLELTESINGNWSICGLQPRGLDLLHKPHDDIESAASCYIHAISGLSGPVHLIGHSYGGLIALEMANKLSTSNAKAASLTLVDSFFQSPLNKNSKLIATPDVLRNFVAALELNLDISICIDENLLLSINIDEFLSTIRQEMIRCKSISHLVTIDHLRGPLLTYIAAYRAPYHVYEPYFDEVNLIVTDDPRLGIGANQSRQLANIDQFRAICPNLKVSRGPGNHFSILRKPHVSFIADKMNSYTMK